MNFCMFCGTTNEDDFTLHKNGLICDECMSVMNYFFNAAYKDIEDIWHKRKPAFEQMELDRGSFLEGCEEYVSYRADLYNKEIRRK